MLKQQNNKCNHKAPEVKIEHLKTRKPLKRQCTQDAAHSFISCLSMLKTNLPMLKQQNNKCNHKAPGVKIEHLKTRKPLKRQCTQGATYSFILCLSMLKKNFPMLKQQNNKCNHKAPDVKIEHLKTRKPLKRQCT